MTAPLAGIRVLEVASWLAAPSAAAMMADMGADVVKVEPPEGDAYRHGDMTSLGYEGDFPTHYGFEVDNRGKRSITISLTAPGGPQLVRDLAKRADIFITNLIQPRREAYGLTIDDIRAANPRIIYTSFSGYGTDGPDAGRAGFDYAAFWARSGVMGLVGDSSSPPPMCRSGQGDHTTALNLLASTLAALRLRDQTGEGQVVHVTLLQTGIWTIAADVMAALRAPQQPTGRHYDAPPNPLSNTYELADGRWILFVMPVADSYWPKFCRMVDRPEWLTEPRYANIRARRENTAELTPQIQAIFRTASLAEWTPRLDAAGLIWAPVAHVDEVVRDKTVRHLNTFAEVTHPQHGPFELLRAPFRIEGADIEPRGAAPSVGEHTYAVLEEAGYSAEDIAAFAADGVFG